MFSCWSGSNTQEYEKQANMLGSVQNITLWLADNLEVWWTGSALDMWYRDICFESRTSFRSLELRDVIFMIPSKQMAISYFQTSHGDVHFSSLCPSYLSLHLVRHYAPSATATVNTEWNSIQGMCDVYVSNNLWILTKLVWIAHYFRTTLFICFSFRWRGKQ